MRYITGIMLWLAILSALVWVAWFFYKRAKTKAKPPATQEK